MKLTVFIFSIALAAATPALANGGDGCIGNCRSDDNSVHSTATGVGVGIGQGGDADASAGASAGAVGINHNGNRNTNRNTATAVGVGGEGGAGGEAYSNSYSGVANSGNSSNHVGPISQYQNQAQKQSNSQGQSQFTGTDNDQATEVNVGGDHYDAPRIPVATAAQSIAHSCMTKGASGQWLGFGGNLALGEDICKLALGVTLASEVGDDATVARLMPIFVEHLLEDVEGGRFMWIPGTEGWRREMKANMPVIGGFLAEVF